MGRHVLRELLDRGVAVVALTRSNPESQKVRAGVEWHSVDIYKSNPRLFRQMGSPEGLLHLAWGKLEDFRSHAHFTEELPAHYRFLEGLLVDGLPALTVTGTCLEYGMKCGALVEDMCPAPTLAYPFAKDTLRKQLEFLQHSVSFELSWTRLFYMFGEGQNPKSLKSQLAAAVDRGDSSFDMSAGEQLRDYLPVSEVARCLVDVALHRPSTGIVNVCSGKPRSVHGLAAEWVKELNSTIRLNLGQYPYPSYEPMAFWGDDTKLRGIRRKSSGTKRKE